jgi:hypothetical protein
VPDAHSSPVGARKLIRLDVNPSLVGQSIASAGITSQTASANNVALAA